MTIARRSIASALATEFSAANVTAPAGESAIQVSDHLLPDRITQTPAVYVFPPEESFTYPPSSRHSAMDWRVRFFLYRLADTGRQTDLLYKWADVLYSQLDDKVHLGLPTSVMLADVAGMKIGALTYGDELFDGIELVIHIEAHEAVTYTG